MSETQQEILVRYLQTARDAVVWKLDGVGEYDARRPLTPTGTSLLGLVKHLATVELGYFVECFGRPLPVVPVWWDALETDPHADLYATADESREEVLGLYRLAWREAGRTFDELELESEGHVPWWGDRNPVTLQWLLVHMIAETNRHAGHMDILREGIDGAAGLRPGVSNLPEDDYDWEAYVARVEAEARHAADMTKKGEE
jgi:uncharacterized damage-inducible protein DinB